jgi:hypothetical protein
MIDCFRNVASRLIWLTLLCGAAMLPLSCSTVVQAPQTTGEARVGLKAHLIEDVIARGIGEVPSDSTEADWEEAFWAIGLTRYRTTSVAAALRGAFDVFDRRPTEFQRALLEAVAGTYPDDFVPEVGRVLEQRRSELVYAMGVAYLMHARGGLAPGELRRKVVLRYPEWQSHPVLSGVVHALECRSAAGPRCIGHAEEMLAYAFPGDPPVVFSLQRADRRYEGRAVVRQPGGRFVRDDRGGYASFRQLALAASNMPGTIRNGNTPGGILSFQGFEKLKNEYIGPTETVQLVLPFEASPEVFFHDRSLRDSLWTRSLYARLVPPGARDQPPFYEAFEAGRGGRNEIIAHGTAIDPEFYRGEPCYPNTPSLGCLTAPETWSPRDGTRLSSEQVHLVEAMKKIDFRDGYVVVVTIDTTSGPVTESEVSALLRAVEDRRFH